MGRCQEFGLQIRDVCGHAMVAGETACSCPECEVICGGRFAGCPDVWARGPQPVALKLDSDEHEAPLPPRVVTNGAAGPSPSALAAQFQAVPPAAEPDASPPGAAVDPEETASVQPTSAAPSTHTPARSPGIQQPASAAALRWLEGAFAGLQSELQSLRGHLNQQQATMGELVNGITQQQALLSELLDARDSDFRLAEAAEALPQFVSDAVAHEARVNRERTVAAIESTLETKLAEAGLEQGTRSANAEETVAELRAVLQNDPATGSIVAAISTQAATQAMRTEMAEQLPKVVNQALASSEARIDELAERMDKLVTRAMRAGARSAAAKSDKPDRARSTTASKRPEKVAKTAAKARVTKLGAAETVKPAKSIKAVSKPTRSAAAADKSTKATKTAKTPKTSRAVKKESQSGPTPPVAKRPARVAPPRRTPAKTAPAAARGGATTGRTRRPERAPARSTAPESA